MWQRDKIVCQICKNACMRRSPANLVDKCCKCWFWLNWGFRTYLKRKANFKTWKLMFDIFNWFWESHQFCCAHCWKVNKEIIASILESEGCKVWRHIVWQCSNNITGHIVFYPPGMRQKTPRILGCISGKKRIIKVINHKEWSKVG